MNTLIDRLRQTDQSKLVAVLRIVAGLPLLLFGVMHLIDPEPFRQILEASGMPFVELNLLAAPLAEVAAGLLLISGYFTRLGGLAGAGTMFAAAWATVILAGVERAPEVPPLPLPLAVLAISTYVLWRGAGAWSLDGRTARATAPTSNPRAVSGASDPQAVA